MNFTRHELEWLREELELATQEYQYPNIAYDILGKISSMLKGDSAMTDEDLSLTCIESHLKVALCHFDKIKAMDSDIAQWEHNVRDVYLDIKSRLEDIKNGDN